MIVAMLGKAPRYLELHVVLYDRQQSLHLSTILSIPDFHGKFMATL
jgi:hypothetical protein